MTKKGASSLIGAHLSISGGHYKAFEQAVEIGANTMQIFTANQQEFLNNCKNYNSNTEYHKNISLYFHNELLKVL